MINHTCRSKLSEQFTPAHCGVPLRSQKIPLFVGIWQKWENNSLKPFFEFLEPPHRMTAERTSANASNIMIDMQLIKKTKTYVHVLWWGHCEIYNAGSITEKKIFVDLKPFFFYYKLYRIIYCNFLHLVIKWSREDVRPLKVWNIFFSVKTRFFYTFYLF